MADVYMRILISATNNASGAIKGVAGDIGGLAPMAIGAGLALAGIGIALGISVEKAASFQQGMTQLVTGAGELQKNLGMVSQGILDMSVATGTSTKQLTDGMFMIESAGFHGADGLRVLQASAEGAKVGNADLGVTADAVTTIMKDYGITSQHAGDAMNFLTAIVQNGKTHMQELAASMSTVLPTASAVGVHLIDVGAAMATMTGEGVPAANAATYLRQMLMSLAAPAKAGATALTNIGLTTQQVSDSMKKSLPDTLKMIMTHLGETYKVGSPEYVTALKNISGGSKQMQGMLDLTGTHLKDFQTNMKNVSGTINQGKGSIVGWSQVQGDFNFKADQAKQALNVLAITIGTKLLPPLTQIMTNITPLITGFMNWATSMSNNQTAMAIFTGILAGLAAVVLFAVVPSIIAMGAAMLSAEVMGAPIILIVLAIIAVVTVVILAIQHWGQIVAWLKGVWSAIAGFFVGLWNNIKSIFMTVINAIVSFFVGIWTHVASFFTGVWNGIMSFLTGIWNVIKKVATIAFLLIVGVILAPFLPLILWIKSNWTAIHAFLTALWNAIKAVATVVWNAIVAVISFVITSIRDTIMAIWNAISGFLSFVWNGIVAVATNIWNTISGVITGVVTTLWNWLSDTWTKIKSDFTSAFNAFAGIAQGAWDTVVGIVKGAINFLIDLINGMIGGVNNVTGALGLPAIGLIPHLASGIENFGGGLAYVHAGEVLTYLPKGSNVIPANRVSMAGGGGRTLNVTNHFTFNVQQLTPQEMDRAVSYMGDKLRAQFGNI